MYRDNWEKSRARATEAQIHKARHTFVEPESLLHLIAVHGEYLRLRQLVERHWKRAEEEQGSGYSNRDLFLWAQGLKWYDQQNELVVKGHEAQE